MPAIAPQDLPEEIQAILNTPAEEGACLTAQPVCHPDKRVTAQLTNDPPLPNQILPWRIVNAKKGDLLLSPGGPSGLIGGLLSKLEPPQYFSHMAIMTQDQVEFRHATASDEWIKDKKFANGSILGVVQGVPTDGIQEDALRYQWPGTITQSVEQAYITWKWKPVVLDANGEPVKDKDGKTIPHPDFSEYEPITDRRYHINAISFSPVWREVDGAKRMIWPVIVKPCPMYETEAIRDALHRVADAAKELHGHYRLYAYTRADIGLDEAFFGPARHERQQTDPNTDCTGSRKPAIPIVQTAPMVCSTFVWLAVKHANLKAGLTGLPQIILDGRNHLSTHQISCPDYGKEHMLRRPGAIDGQTLDGLCFYEASERLTAGKWLHDEYMVPAIQKEVAEQLPGLAASLGISAGLFQLSTILKLLEMHSLSVVAQLLGVSVPVLKEIILFTSDMPDDVANQVCNAFASDFCSEDAKDSQAWRENSGTGYTVSPDDTLNSWVAPQAKSPKGFLHGVYGYNDRIRMRPPELARNPPPPSTWQISQGFAEVWGSVFVNIPGAGKVPLTGATVRIGCHQMISGVNMQTPGGFGGFLPSGKYWCVASFTDVRENVHLESAGQIVIIPDEGGIGPLEIELLRPPDTRREVLIHGHMDLINRHTFGKDWTDHPNFACDPAYLGLGYFPDTPEFHQQFVDSRNQRRGTAADIEDWGFAEASFDLSINDDLSLTVRVKGRLRERDNEEMESWFVEKEILVPPKAHFSHPGHEVKIELFDPQFLEPVRATIIATIDNNLAP